MTREQYDNWKAFRESKSNPTSAEAKMVARYYADVFNKKYWIPCSCNKKRWQQWIDELNKHFLSTDRPAE